MPASAPVLPRALRASWLRVKSCAPARASDFSAWQDAHSASGGFLQNLTLSAVSRLLTYGAICIALVVFRRRERLGDDRVGPAWLRIPAGTPVALLGLGFTAVLALRMNGRELLVLAATLLAGLAHWSRMRRGSSGPSRASPR